MGNSSSTPSSSSSASQRTQEDAKIPPRAVVMAPPGIAAKTFRINSKQNPDMCMTSAADGVKMVKCSDAPEQYWGFIGAEAVDRAVKDSSNAGAEKQSTQVESKLATAPVAPPAPPVPPPAAPAAPPAATEKFEGSFGVDGLSLRFSIFDLLFLLLVVYIFYKVL